MASSEQRSLSRAGAATLFALFGCLLGAAPLAQAGSFEVNPIRIVLKPTERSGVLSVSNSGADPVVVQISVQAWSQEDGHDVLAPTKEVLVSPPIATIAPGGKQVVRVGLRRAPDAQRELSYRLFIQEVPPPPKPGFQGLQVALRISLPIFVEPRTGLAHASLVWGADLRGDGSLHLTLDNRGTGHIQISDVELSLPGEAKPVATQRGVGYLLPDQSRQWDLKLRQANVKKNDRLRLKASTDAGVVETEIGLGGR